LSPEEIANLKGSYDLDRILKILKENGALLSGEENTWEKIKLYRAGGCEQCGGEGYKGRLGIFEVLEIDDNIKKMISQKNLEEEIEKTAKENGMLTMLEDGFLKAARGFTSLEEVFRVTKE
jgi:type II secretory ATPase GspE/PulE/Tfp pilus assembly ATPase PilB-like protein